MKHVRSALSKIISPSILFLALALIACTPGMPLTKVDIAQDQSIEKGEVVSLDSAASCLRGNDAFQPLVEPQKGYCLLYPFAYKVEMPNPESTVLVMESLLNTQDPRVEIVVAPAGGRTAETRAQEIADEVPPGFDIERSTRLVAGEIAHVVDRLPGQEISRRVIFVHNALMYDLTFLPVLDNDDEPHEAMDAFYTQILDSFTFIPPSDIPVDVCLEETSETHLWRDEELGYCILLPKDYDMVRPTEAEVLFYANSLLNVEAPRLFISLEEIGDESLQKAVDAFLAGYPENAGIERVFGQTIGYAAAERLEHVPGQDISRVLLVKQGEHLYRLTFVPGNPEDEDRAKSDFDAFFDLVVRSFRFLPTGQ